MREDIRLQYLYFVANVAAKAEIKKESSYYFSAMVELLDSSVHFLQFNKRLLTARVGSLIS